MISETKLNEEFPNAQFSIFDYEIKSRRDRNKHRGWLLEFIRKTLICKTVAIPSNITSEIISSELTIKNEKWIVLRVYKPPKESNLITFFQDLTFLLNKHLSTYDNVVVIGDFNIDAKEVTNESLQKLNTFCETFGLSILAKGYTCYSKTHKSSLDLILTRNTTSCNNRDDLLHLSFTLKVSIFSVAYI